MKPAELLVSWYDRILQLAGRPDAEKYLCGLSAAEAVFFPIPPDVMLIPMGLADNQRVWRFALLCTVASVAGACIGYALGFLGGEALQEWLNNSRWSGAFAQIQSEFLQHGVWIMLLAGFTPLPYKIFTLSAGLLGLAFPLFIMTSLIGRASRFMLVAALIRLGGPSMAERIRPIVAKAGWYVLILVVSIYLCWMVWR